MLPDIQAIIDLAKHVGDDILIANWGHVTAEEKSDGSPVTVVDKQASKTIIEGLQALTPDIPVISEEATKADNIEALKAPQQWIVDPLDGTSSYLKGPEYLNGQPEFGVHIALLENGSPVKGVVYLPAIKTIFFTGEDGNAYIAKGNDAPEIIKAPQIMQGALVAAVPETEHKRPLTIHGHSYQPLSIVGSSKICSVACGDADIMWQDRPDKKEPMEERDVFSYWDVAAGHAILKAAGGNLYDIKTGEAVRYDQDDFFVSPCVAASPEILTQIGFFLSQSCHYKKEPGGM